MNDLQAVLRQNIHERPGDEARGGNHGAMEPAETPAQHRPGVALTHHAVGVENDGNTGQNGGGKNSRTIYIGQIDSIAVHHAPDCRGRAQSVERKSQHIRRGLPAASISSDRQFVDGRTGLPHPIHERSARWHHRPRIESRAPHEGNEIPQAQLGAAEFAELIDAQDVHELALSPRTASPSTKK